jgi:tetratricopeptide (TPR) repeat protein
LNRKYLFGAIGLGVSFIAMFFFTKTINQSAPPASASANRPAARTQGGAAQPNQQQMMADVRETIEKANNNPTDFEAQLAAAETYLQIRQTEKGIEYVKKAIEANPKEAATYGLQNFMATYYSRQKNYAEAEKWYRRLIEVAPEDSNALVHLGQNFLERTPPEPDKAVMYIQSALKLKPDDGHALGHLISAFALKKDVRRAEDTFNRLKEVEPANKMIPDYESMIADLKAGKPVTIPTEN